MPIFCIRKGTQQYSEANTLLITLIANRSITEDINERIKEIYNQYSAFITFILKSDIEPSPFYKCRERN